MDEIPDLTDEPLAVTTLYPEPDEFKTDEELTKEKESELQSRLGPSCDVVGITHTDADGYGAAVMLKAAFPGKDTRIVTAHESGALKLSSIGDLITENISDDVEIFIMDLCPNDSSSESFINPFKDYKTTVVDHHEWSDDALETVREHSILIHDMEHCATKLVYDEILQSERTGLSDLANLTEDHDLWIKNRREESDKLADLVFMSDIDTYIKMALEHGSDIINTEWGMELIEKAAETREKKNDIAESRTNFFDINGYSITIAYGDCAQSSFGERIQKKYDVDIVFIMFPKGKISIRSSEDTPIARDIAVKLGGGGHDCAAGAYPDFIPQDIDYVRHWATMGKDLSEYILTTVEYFLMNNLFFTALCGTTVLRGDLFLTDFIDL